MNFFRTQHKGYTFEQMKQHSSQDGGDGYTEGLCVSDSPDEFGGALEAMENEDEVIVMKGIILREIYDGYRIQPTEEIARFTVKEWNGKIKNEMAWDYEDWS